MAHFLALGWVFTIFFNLCLHRIPVNSIKTSNFERRDDLAEWGPVCGGLGEQPEVGYGLRTQRNNFNINVEKSQESPI